MLRRVWSPLLIALACACRLAGPPAEAPPPGRVVLLSFDGLGASAHRDRLARGVYHEAEGFTAFERAFVVERAIPVEPTLTAVSHAAIACGVPPARTGIVGNRIHLPGTALGESVSGFTAGMAAEPLWRRLRRAGRRVAVLGFPGHTLTERADLGLVWVEPVARARSLRLGAERFTSAALPGRSFAVPRRAVLEIALEGEAVPSRARFHLTALDASDDGVSNYDTLIADDDADLGNGVLATVRVGDWFPLHLEAAHPDGGRRRLGAWCLLTALPADLDGVGIYRGAFHALEAYPRPFRERVEQQVGFWPGQPDAGALADALAGRPGLAVADFIAQARRLSEYLSACARTVLAGEGIDVLLAYQSLLDEVQHALLITDPRQDLWSEPLARRAAAAVDDAFSAADRASAVVWGALDAERDALVVVSDHGLTPVFEVVHVNEVLRRAGLAEAGEDGRLGAGSRAGAIASGGVAQIWVNLAGREPGGVVSPSAKGAVLREAARALALVEVDGRPAVAAMIHPDERSGHGRGAGDLLVFFTPGIAADGGIGGAVSEPRSGGMHGFRAAVPDMHGIWLARGAGVASHRQRRAPLTDVAAFVESLAGARSATTHPQAAQPENRGWVRRERAEMPMAGERRGERGSRTWNVRRH